MELRKAGALIETLPLRRLSEILVMERCAVSSALLRKCVRGGVPITFTLGSGYHIATLAPDSRHHHDLAYRQARRYYAMSETERLALASAFATVKIRNYLSLFRQRYEAGMAEFLAGLEGLIEAMQGADTVAAVRGYEGAAAKLIFKRLNQHIAIEAFRSPSRKRRNPDRLNSLLNFGYYLLFSRINAALRALGLNPYLGFLHDGRDDYESLVCDVQELFRARIDRLVLRLINLKVIQAGQFKETERGLRLLPEGAKAYVLHFERELAQREAAGELGLGEILHAQCLNLKLHLCDGQPLALYKWQV